VDRINSTRGVRDVKEWERMQKPSIFLVAATFEKAKTYVFTERKIRDREVGRYLARLVTLNDLLFCWSNLENACTCK
jgi:hypothetical protein